MEIIYFEKIDSTQKYLIKKIKNSQISPPVCIYTQMQTDGVGSRDSKWIGKKGNLFFSFAHEMVFEDVPLQSLSIYFGWIFKKSLNDFGSAAVMKWPNDIYLIEDKPRKIGGVITNIIKNTVVCGIGLNTVFAPSQEFGSLDIEIKNDKILKRFFSNLSSKTKWSDVISEFKEEFAANQSLFNIKGDLMSDGSIQNNKKRIYSRR